MFSSRFNLPPGTLASDTDPPETCAMCGEVLGTEIWRDDNQTPYCGDCVQEATERKMVENGMN